MKLVVDEVANLQHDLDEVRKIGMDEVQKCLDALQNFRDSIEKRLTQLENRVEEQHKEQSETNEALSSAIGDLSKNVKKVGVRQDESEVKMANLERDQKDLHASVDVLERKSAYTEQKVKALESSLEDHVNASATNEATAFLVPRRNSCFCGRANELSAILGILKGNQNSCLDTAIYGLGGIGKTSLAVEYIWRHKNEYPGGIFWISGESNITFQSSVREMALEMQITSPEIDFSFTLMKALAWLKKQGKMWCLVVDNLDQLEMSEDMRKLLRGKWKQGSRGHVIITTRREPREILKETGVEEKSCIELKRLTQEQSVEFLRKKTGRTEGEDSEVRELASELGGLPLALDQAAAYIRYLPCSISDYVKQYREQIEKLELLKKMEAQEPDEYTSPDRLAVHTTWLMNFEHITNSKSYDKEIRVVATLLMEIFAFLGPDDIPTEVFNEGLPPVDSPSLLNVMSSPLRRIEVLSLLTNLSLFQQFGANSYSVHRLVQEVIRTWMDEKRKEDAFCKDFFPKEFAFIAGTRFLHHALSNTRSPVDVCKEFSEDAVFSVKNPPSLYLWGKLASHATYFLDHMRKFTTKNEECACILLHTGETVRLLNESAISYSVAREKVKAQEIQKKKLGYLTLLEKSPSEETLNLLLHFNMPLKDKYYKLISHCMRERPSNPEDSSDTHRINHADQLRQEGNQAVQVKEYGKALSLYNKAIELNSKDYRLYSNRALCHLKLSKPKKALDDCEECLSLKPNYGKALLRKVWALDELMKGAKCQDNLKGNAVATAALAHHLDSNADNRRFINERFTDLDYEVISSDNQLEQALRFRQAPKTLLLREGEYNVSQFLVAGFDTHVVGLGSGAVLNCRQVFVVQNVTCFFQNVRFPSGNPPLVCQGASAIIHFSHCEISAGFSRCQDYPECNGGEGCVAASRGKPNCDRTLTFGVPYKSGFTGYPGIQVKGGSTVYITRSQIHHCGGGGALVSEKGSRLFVQKCEVYSNQNGLEATNGGQLTAKENNVYGNCTHGFLIGPEPGCCFISNNQIFENHKEGVYVANNKQEALVTVDGNDIHHNMAFGLSLTDCHLSISNNKIFENGFWGILCITRTSAKIMGNDIFGNKCGGIFIGINFCAKVSINSNVIRDHAGPCVHYLEEPFRDASRIHEWDPYFRLPPGETNFYSYPPTQESNQVFNNTEGLFHPEEAIERLETGCCHCFSKLCQKGVKRCPECYIAVYCGLNCLQNHRQKHKSLCEVLKRRYSTTVELLETCENDKVKVRFFGPHLKDVGKCPPPKRNGSQAFIVKVETSPLNCHPKQLLFVYDKSLSVDHGIQSSDVFNMVMECGVLGEWNKFTSKKTYFWATFADGGNKLDIFLSHLAPYQQW